jgi:serine protease AprX
MAQPSRPQILSLTERLDTYENLSGKGVCIGFVDAGFFAHPDLTHPLSRIRAFVDITKEPPDSTDFMVPNPGAWHGTMTACCAAGNGYRSGGRYRGLAHHAHLVLIKARDSDGNIRGSYIVDALKFVQNHPELGIQILNISLGVEEDDPDVSEVEKAVNELVEQGIVVIAAAGNNPGTSPSPPASAKLAITVGGQNDQNTRDTNDDTSWPSTWGTGEDGVPKPDLLAPSVWLPAPMLPGTLVAREAPFLFQLLSILEENEVELHFRQLKQETISTQESNSLTKLIKAVQERIQYRKYIAHDYQHVDGTSFAAPIVSSVVAQMLEACPKLNPTQVRKALLTTAVPLQGVPKEIQGDGVLQPKLAIDWAMQQSPPSTRKQRKRLTFYSTNRSNDLKIVGCILHNSTIALSYLHVFWAFRFFKTARVGSSSTFYTG